MTCLHHNFLVQRIKNIFALTNLDINKKAYIRKYFFTIIIVAIRLKIIIFGFYPFNNVEIA